MGKKRLCIDWQVNGRCGKTSPKPETPENITSIYKELVWMQATWPHGDFSIRTIEPSPACMPRNY